jgi:hypothetical protein
VPVLSIALCVAAVGTAVGGSRGNHVADAIAVVLVVIGAALSLLGSGISRPRGLAAGQRRVLLQTLGRLTPLEVRVSAVDDKEAIRCAHQLRSVIAEARWPVTGVYKSRHGGNGTGVTLAVRNVVIPPGEAITLMNTLRGIGVPATWRHQPDLPGDRTIEVVVGRQR